MGDERSSPQLLIIESETRPGAVPMSSLQGPRWAQVPPAVLAVGTSMASCLRCPCAARRQRRPSRPLQARRRGRAGSGGAGCSEKTMGVPNHLGDGIGDPDLAPEPQDLEENHHLKSTRRPIRGIRYLAECLIREEFALLRAYRFRDSGGAWPRSGFTPLPTFLLT